MATLHLPLNLNTTSLQDMLDVGWIPPQDAEEIVRQHGLSRHLYLAWLLRTTSLSQMKLDQLVQPGMVTVHFQDDDNLKETQSLLSDTSSMHEKMGAICEENRFAVRGHGAADVVATRYSGQVCGGNGNMGEVGPYSCQGAARQLSQMHSSGSGAAGGKAFINHECI